MTRLSFSRGSNHQGEVEGDLSLGESKDVNINPPCR